MVTGRVLDHGRPRNTQLAGHPRMRQVFRLELPDILSDTHRYRYSFPPEDHVSVAGTRESIRNRTAPVLLFRPCRFPVRRRCPIASETICRSAIQNRAYRNKIRVDR